MDVSLMPSPYTYPSHHIAIACNLPTITKKKTTNKTELATWKKCKMRAYVMVKVFSVREGVEVVVSDNIFDHKPLGFIYMRSYM